jgi:acyl-CoA thioester hydrolase
MKHRTEIQIRFNDVDALGHVNNAVHVTWFELARIKYFDAKVGGDIDWEREGMILAHTSISYKTPIYLKDTIEVLTWFSKAGNTSFELMYEIIRKEADGSETICATGSSVQVCFNYKENKPVPVPEKWLEAMQK